LDRAGSVHAFDFDALFGRELELHVVIEQTAIGCV
jgi:Na+-translocating ferredoxin:NAD+ oxidoreductase RNF subunit RnfB